MNYERAMEIFNSPKTFEVLYDGNPVWIEGLDPSRQTATVASGTFSDGKKTVPVTQLVESHEMS